MIVGIGLYLIVPQSPGIYLIIAAAFALLAIWANQQHVAASVYLLFAFSFAGLALAQAEFFRYASDDVGGFTSEQPHLVQLELSVDEPPKIVSTVIGNRPLPPKQMFTASTRRILTKDGWSDASGLVLVEIKQPDPLLAQGQQIRVIGMLGRPAPASNPGQFDWAAYYRQQRVLSTLAIAHPSNVQIIANGGFAPVSWLRQRARDLLAMGFPARGALDHALLRALVFGDSDPMLHDVQDSFGQLGVAYQLSVSGMHVAVLAACVLGICRWLMHSPRKSSWLCLIVVITYGIIALPAGPILRAVVLCTALLLGTILRRGSDKLQMLAIAASLLLLLHPLDLTGAGFQLGFITILGLILLGRPALRWIADRTIPPSESTHWLKALRIRLLRILLAWTALSGIAWATALPLVAYHFGSISSWAVPAALILFPLVSLALLGGCAKIVMTFAWPSLAPFWAHLAASPVEIMRHLVERMSHLPGASVTIAQPSIIGIVLYYLLLISPRLPWPRIWLMQIARCAAVFSVCGLFVFISLGAAPIHAPEDAATITLLDVGAGQCAVAHVPGLDPILIDAGSDSIADVTRSCIGPYLRLNGYSHIGQVFLSHSDYDHISAVTTVAKKFGIGSVYLSPLFARFAKIDPPAQATLDALAHPPLLIHRGDHLDLGKGATLDVLWPTPDSAFNCNDTGLVLRLTFAGRSILFPADIQANAMRELLKSPEQLKADVLVAAHHGSSEMTTADFVRAVDPSIIVSSNSGRLTNKQKRFETLIGSRPLYRTSAFGAVTIRISREGHVSLDTFRHPAAAGVSN